MEKYLNEEEMIGDDVYAKELLNIQTWYNQEDQKLKNILAKKRMSALQNYQKRAQQQAVLKATQSAAKTTANAATTTKPALTGTGNVDSTGARVNAQGNKVTQESYSNILRIKELNEETFDTHDADSETIQDLKDYMDAENISYIEDEDQTTLDFDKEELDLEWIDELPNMGLEEIGDDVETDDILDYTDDEDETIEDDEYSDEEDLVDTHEEIDEKKVFYVKVTDADGDFTGKVYKLFDDGDWRARVTEGNSETFEKLNYDPMWDEHDILAFLHENYDDAELISEEEFNDEVETTEPEIEESHKIQTYEQFLNEAR